MKDHTKKCKKCGLPLGFKKLESGKWCPTNPDGSDHWDLCRETWLAALSDSQRDYLARRDAARAKGVWTGKISHAYAGDVPPWDESLGKFREFTAAEIADGTARKLRKVSKRRAVGMIWTKAQKKKAATKPAPLSARSSRKT